MKYLVTCAVALVLLNFPEAFGADSLTINANGRINDHADRIGIWINAHEDAMTPEFRSALKDMKVNIIRYGLGYSVFNKNDLTKLEPHPIDPEYENFSHNFGPSGVADLLDTLKAEGMYTGHVSGINYGNDTGAHRDTMLWRMTEQQRADFYKGRTVDFVNWSKANNKRFKYIEIGNEENLNDSIIKLQPARKYAKYAMQFAQAIKTANPSLEVGINGTAAAPAKEWFDSIYTAEPSINNYIDFFVAHVYGTWMWYPDFRDHPTWECSGMECVSYLRTHFPKGHVHVTEFSTFEGSSAVQHWRAVSLVNTIRYMFSFPEVFSAEFWGTKWSWLGAFYTSAYNLQTLGIGLKCYTQFMHHRLVDQGVKGNLRYMALKDSTNGALSVYLINGDDSARTVSVTIDAFAAGTSNERWELFTPTGDPNAWSLTQLTRNGSVALTSAIGSRRTFTTECKPVSVTVVSFTSASTSLIDPTHRRLSNLLYVSADRSIAMYDLTGRRMVFANVNNRHLKSASKNIGTGVYFCLPGLLEKSRMQVVVR